jgi:hypothetical protein
LSNPYGTNTARGSLDLDGRSELPHRISSGAESLPELIVEAKAHGRQVLAGHDVKVRVFLVPDKVPPEPVVELHLIEDGDLGPESA